MRQLLADLCLTPLSASKAAGNSCKRSALAWKAVGVRMNARRAEPGDLSLGLVHDSHPRQRHAQFNVSLVRPLNSDIGFGCKDSHRLMLR